MRIRVSYIAVLGWIFATAFFFTPLAGAAEADELALSERVAAFADRYGNTAAAGPYKQAIYDAAGRLSQRNVRFRRNRFQAAALAGDADAMLATLQEWRKLEPASLFVQMRLIDVHLTKVQTADARLAYLEQIIKAESVDAQVRSHAAVQAARLQVEQSRTQLAMETLRRAVLLNGLNREALQLQWQLSVTGSTPIQRVSLLLAMLKADPGAVDNIVRVAEELAFLDMTQESLQWYGHASTIAAPVGGLNSEIAKDYAAELLIAGQDRGAAELGSRLLGRNSSDPGAWFLTLLAERGMKDRIELVKKNALIGILNNVALARTSIGAREATTQPLGSDFVSMPDLSSDLPLLEKATPEKKRDYVSAVADLAWLLVYHDDKPAQAAAVIKVLNTAASDDAGLLARLNGWMLLKAGKVEEARAVFAGVADQDPLSAIGMLRILKQDPASATAATDLARRLVRGLPARLLGAYVRAEVGNIDIASADTTVDAVRDMLDRFPREILRMSIAPQEFLNMRLQPQHVGHEFADPMLVDIELRNLKEYPVVVGPTGMARDVWLDVQSRGLLQQWISGVSFEKIDGPVILPAGGAMRWTVRMDRGPLRDVLERTIQQAIQLSVFGLSNAVPTEAGVVPGPCGIRGRMSQMLERRSSNLASEAALRKAHAIVGGEDAVAKLSLVDQVSAHLWLNADPEGPANVKAIDAELRDLLGRLAQDSTVSVRTWAKFQAARVKLEPAEKTAGDLSAETNWIGRLLAAMASMETSETTRTDALAKLANDEDATVRRLAQAIPAAMVKQEGR